MRMAQTGTQWEQRRTFLGERARGRSWRAGRAADGFDCGREVVGVGWGAGESRARELA